MMPGWGDDAGMRCCRSPRGWHCTPCDGTAGSPAPRPRPVLQAQRTVSPGLRMEVPLGAGPACRAKPCRRRSEGGHWGRILPSGPPPGVRAKELSSQVLAGPRPGLPGASGCCAAQICARGQSDAVFLQGIEGAGAVSCLQQLLQVSAQKD